MDYNTIKQFARKLRKNQTKAEEILWNELRKRKLNGLKFLRQHPIIYDRYKNDFFFFIADFYCAEKKLIIEVEGKIHDFQKDNDKRRELILEDMGLKVFHINNEKVEKNIKNVKQKILSFINSPPISKS
jgi:very-short-patch-repair endonuclease